MARHLPLLDATQRRAFDQPPVFNHPQRQLFFALPDWATQFLATLLAGVLLPIGRIYTLSPLSERVAQKQAIKGRFQAI